MRRRHTPPAPLERGDLDAVFLFGNEWIMAWWIPLSRGEFCGTVFLLVMVGLSGGVSPLERGLRGVLR